MKVFISIAMCLVLAVTLSIQQVNCEPELSTQVGKEYLKDFKKYSFELFKTKLQIWEQFVEELIEDSKPTAEQKAKLVQQQNFLTDLLEHLDTMKEDELIAAIYNFVDESYTKRYFPEAKDAKHARRIDHALFQSILQSKIAEFKFVINIGAAWNKLYREIPAEELANHPEYNEIFRLLYAARKSKANGRDVHKLCERLVQFFHNKDWLYLLGISKDGERVKAIINAD